MPHFTKKETKLKIREKWSIWPDKIFSNKFKVSKATNLGSAYSDTLQRTHSDIIQLKKTTSALKRILALFANFQLCEKKCLN